MAIDNEVEINSEICPFVNDALLNLSKFDKLKLALMSVTVGPIRLVFVSLSLLVLWGVAMIPTAFRPKEMTNKPLESWRLWAKPIIRFVSRTVFFFGGFHWIKVFGKEDENVKILALAPHSSYFDVLGIVYLNFPSAIGRAGSEDVPLFGHLTKLTQPLIVDRENQSSRSTVVKKILERVNSPLKWPKLAIYTEGTCTNRKVLLQFKSGAFLPGLPVQPVCFVYKTNMDTISWSWKGPSAYMLLWLTLCQLNNAFELHYLPVYYPNDEEKKNAELYANNVRIAMAKYLQIPISEYSFEDVRLMTRVEKYGLPWISGQIKVNQLIKKLGVNLDAIFDIVPLYAKIADLGTGLTNINSLSNYMQIKPTESLHEFFYSFDKSKKGSFGFSNFVEAYFTVISKKLSIQSDEAFNELEQFLTDLKFTDTTKYTYKEFNKLLLQKLNIEMENFDLIDVNKTQFITKNDFNTFLNNNSLYLFYFLNLSKNRKQN